MTPKDLGFYFPAEWEKHKATWLNYPHNENSWPGKIDTIYPSYHIFIKFLADVEVVHINVISEAMKQSVYYSLLMIGTNMSNVHFHVIPTNDAWTRDCGPAFLLNRNDDKQKAIVNWTYNAWGGKYPCDLDNEIPLKVAELLNLKVFEPGIVMEGGSVDFNGVGDVLTTKACLLNPNRNPSLTQGQIEEKLCNFYGVDNVIWLGDGIEGDDTDGHVDDLSRFVNEDTIVTVVETNEEDENYLPLKENLALLNKVRLSSGKQPNVVELPMPDPVIWEDQRLPASYANFYIANNTVIMPVFKCEKDNKAYYILEECFKDKTIQAVDSTDIIWGLGSFHCLSQQEPELKSAKDVE
jgi:agmatine deiminase